MPDWKETLDDINKLGTPYDVVRRHAILDLHNYTGRNVIIYYSGWLQKPHIEEVSVNDMDINGLMTNIHGIEDKNCGLDLILHTPGGSIAATETIVNYLRKSFNCDIRAIVPQLAMSAGTMIACSCSEILMGKQSSLGPIDPQFFMPYGQVPAQAVLNEVRRAVSECETNPAAQVVWGPILSKYHPTFIGTCENAVAWSKEVTVNWLKTCMFKDESNPEEKAKNVVKTLADHDATKSHSRHLSVEQCKEIGLKIVDLESDNTLQDLVLSIHHACMATFHQTPAIKIIENHLDKSFVLSAIKK